MGDVQKTCQSGTAIVLAVPSEPTLAELAEVTNREHYAVLQAGTSMILHAVTAGEALLAAKRLVPRGQWQQWLVDNLADKSLSTPRTYMRFARYKDDLLSVQPTNMKTARKLIAGGADSRYDPYLVGDAKRLREDGLTTVAIAGQLGVSRSTISRWLNPEGEKRRLSAAKRQTIAGRRALNRERRDGAAKRVGGSVADTYSLVRRALKRIECAIESEEDHDARRSLQDAMNRLYNAEDAIVKAVGTTRQSAAV